MCRPLMKICGTVPRPVMAPTTRERSLWIELHFEASQLRQQRLRLGAVAAALARQDRDLVGLLRLGIDVVEHGIGVGHLERVARLLRLDEHLLDHPVLASME